MITSKQRAKLRGLANGLDTILQIGKGGVIDATMTQVDDALTARELIKLRVLETCPVSSTEAARQIAQQLKAEVVQVIGSRFVLFRPNPKDSKIEI